MVQFGPDTSPAEKHSVATTTATRQLRGFSLTHLNGAGCSLYGDFPSSPQSIHCDAPRRRRKGRARRPVPGPLQPRCRSAPPPAITAWSSIPRPRRSIVAALTATTRTGVGRFTYPRGGHAGLLIDAGGSAQPGRHRRRPDRPGPPRDHRLGLEWLLLRSAAALPGLLRGPLRPAVPAHRDLAQGDLQNGSTSASDQKPPSRTAADTAQAGAYVGFDTRRSLGQRPGRRLLRERRRRSAEPARRVGPLSLRPRGREGAAALGCGAEPRPGTGRLRRDLRTFYTALYHVFLAPRTFSDADGSYIGMDGQLHTGRPTQYADFSGWDIYRSQIPLLAMLMPGRTSELVDSLLADAAAERLPSPLAVRERQSMTMVGDPSDPIIAAAAAFGADGFDSRCRSGGDGQGSQPALREPRRLLRRAPGHRRLSLARLRALRPRHEQAKRELDLRQPRRRLGLGVDHARVRGSRLRHRPVRGPGRARRSDLWRL